jgi:predicted MFS family arabinose efflux permease
MLIFILYTAGNSMGAVARTNCVSLIPSTEERTGFMLLHGAVCCIGIAVGSFFSSLLLQTSVNGQLIGMQQVAVIAMILSLVFPVAILWLKYKFLREGNKNSC